MWYFNTPAATLGQVQWQRDAQKQKPLKRMKRNRVVLCKSWFIYCLICFLFLFFFFYPPIKLLYNLDLKVKRQYHCLNFTFSIYPLPQTWIWKITAWLLMVHSLVRPKVGTEVGSNGDILQMDTKDRIGWLLPHSCDCTCGVLCNQHQRRVGAVRGASSQREQ